MEVRYEAATVAEIDVKKVGGVMRTPFTVVTFGVGPTLGHLRSFRQKEIPSRGY